MSSTTSANEKRPLKRPRLGPPDFYPQEVKQKEDELTLDKLKAGYINQTLHGEHESAVKSQKLIERLDECVNKVAQSYSAIVAKKNDNNTWQDRGDKKKPGSKEIGFWHASAKPKDKDIWFRDLAGNKSLTLLAKRFPIFNKKEEIFGTLCEFGIPMSRAVWFIKMTAAYYTMQQESKSIKKKQQSDPCSEWTNHLTRFLRELLTKLNDYYKLNSQTVVTTDVEKALKEWHYCVRLTRHMYEEGLLDRSDFLGWMLDILNDKCFHPEFSGILKLFIPFMMQYLDGIKLSQALCRRLASTCCRKLYQLYLEFDGCPSPNSSTVSRVTSPVTCYNEYMKQCGYHRHLVLSLSAMLHAILLDCPTSLVWNYLGDSLSLTDTKHAYLCGSPLDNLPCIPSALPIPDGPGQDKIKLVLRIRELDVIRRSQAVESRWSSSKYQQSGLAKVVPLMLTTLDALDQAQFFAKDSIDDVYGKIFNRTSEENDDGGDMTVVKLLCHWAVTPHRVGSHRPLVVVRLLERRAKEMGNQLFGQENSGNCSSSSNYPFQQTLYSFLDSEAPLGESDNELSSVVHLFCELIRVDLMSHDKYVRTLISNGELNSSNPICAAMAKRNNEDRDFGEPDEPRVDMQNVWSSLADDKIPVDKAVRTPLSVSSSAPDSADTQAPSSVESYTEPCSLSAANAALQLLPSATKGQTGSSGRSDTITRHQRCVVQFPIPQEEQYRHECNQRQTLLFGFGQAREAHKHALKKLTKELNKVGQKKSCIECSENGSFKMKKKVASDNLNNLSFKFKELCFYDQHVVLGMCVDSCLDQLRDFTTGESQILPAAESVDFFLFLMESAKDVAGLTDFIEEATELLCSIETEMIKNKSQLAGIYGFRICTVFVGYLRHNLAYFIMCTDELTAIVNNMLSLVDKCMDVRQPGAMNIWERAVLVFLSDLKDNWPEDRLKAARDRCLKGANRMDERPSSANLKWDANFMRDNFENPKKCMDVYDLVNSKGMNREREGASLRYSFVINALLAASRCEKDSEKSSRLSELGIFCANVGTACPLMTSEWLGALRALCCSGNLSTMDQGFSDLLMQIDINDQSIHSQIATFAMILVVYRCISLSDLSLHVFVPSLFLPLSAKGDTEAEAGALLTLRIVAAVFSGSEESTQLPGAMTVLNSERYLLSSEHFSMVPRGVLTVLIAVFLLADSGLSSLGESKPAESQSKDTPARRFSAETLSAICSQDWIKQKFVYLADLLTDKYLLIKNLNNEQAQRLLRLISRRSLESQLIIKLNKCDNGKDLIIKELTTLSLWNMRAVYLDISLSLKQTTPIAHMGLLEVISKACMDLFHNQSQSVPRQSTFNQPTTTNHASFCVGDVTNIWLIAPLISRLSTNVQGKVLRAAAQVLETGQLSRKEKTIGGPQQQSSWLLSQQPFLCLVLTCLRGQDEQRESILNSLLKQLQDCVQRAKENPTCIYQRDFATEIRDGLQLRLSLVGGMFETVCKGSSCEQWALLLFQLILYNIVSADSNKILFETCLDMLTVLIHASQIPEAGNSSEESRRLYLNVVRKLRKEIADKTGHHCLHQLLPIPRAVVDLVCCEPYGATPSTSQSTSSQKPSKSTNVSAISEQGCSSRPGLRFTEKQRVSPWELVEGYRGWNWSWFQAVKVDVQPETVQGRLTRLLHHDHYHSLARHPLPGQQAEDKFLEPLKVDLDPDSMPRQMAPQPHEGMTDMGMMHHQQQMIQQRPDQLSFNPAVSLNAPIQQHQMMVQHQVQSPMFSPGYQPGSMPTQDPWQQQPDMPPARGGAKGRQRRGAGGRTNKRNKSSSGNTTPVFTAPPSVFPSPPQQQWPPPQQPAMSRFPAPQNMVSQGPGGIPTGRQAVTSYLTIKNRQPGPPQQGNDPAAIQAVQVQMQQQRQQIMESMQQQQPQMRQQPIQNPSMSYGGNYMPGAGGKPMNTGQPAGFQQQMQPGRQQMMVSQGGYEQQPTMDSRYMRQPSNEQVQMTQQQQFPQGSYNRVPNPQYQIGAQQVRQPDVYYSPNF